MNKLLVIFEIFLVIFLAFPGCQNEDINKVDPPARVILVPRSPDTSSVEHGIDAIYLDSQPNRNAIFLEWHPNLENTLAGYAIYRSESSNRNFANIARITQNFGFDTLFIDNSVSLYQRYYYFIRAFDELDQYGSSSDTISYALVENPILSAPIGLIGSNRTPIFIWDFPANFVPHYFVYRLERKQNQVYNNFYTQLLEMGADYDPHQEWRLSRATLLDSLNPGEYRWRIDPVGSELNQGSESAWLVFIIQ